MVAVRTTARMTAFSPGQSPPPVKRPIFMYFIIVMSWVVVLLLTTIAVFLARSLSFRPALPILATIAGYFPFVMEVQISFARGLLILCFWTFVLSVLILFFCRKEPERME